MHLFCFNYVMPVRVPKQHMVDYFKLDCVDTDGELIGVIHDTHGEADIPYRLFKVIGNDQFLCSETAEPMG